MPRSSAVPNANGLTPNRLLRGLPSKEWAGITAALETVELKLHATIYDDQDEIEAVYFPETAMISLVTEMQNGTTVEMGVVGRFGMAGLPAFLGGRRAGNDAMVQIGGISQRMGVAEFRTLVVPGTRLYSRLLQYTQSFLRQSGQAAACNALHSLPQRCARWLLTVADQIGTDSFELTQEFLSQMLGVRRASIAIAQSGLREKGLITARRGHVAIRNRSGLERIACECFRIIHEETTRSLA